MGCVWVVIWVVLVLAAVVVLAALSWRIFTAVRRLLSTVGQSTSALSAAGVEAEERHEQWLATRAAADEAFYAARIEQARPVPRGLLDRGDLSLTTDALREAP